MCHTSLSRASSPRVFNGRMLLLQIALGITGSLVIHDVPWESEATRTETPSLVLWILAAPVGFGFIPTTMRLDSELVPE